jgi:hypothetical protein
MSYYFPQLATGTSGQFPLRRTLVRRTVVNRLDDGREIRLADPDAALIRWELEYRGLSDAERVALATLFDNTRGRLKTFVFFDPCGNLLRRSEELTNAVWSHGGTMQVHPNDGFTRLMNPAPGPQSIAQTLDLPGWFHYCGSALFRAAEGSPGVTLRISTPGGSISSETPIGSDWTIAACSGSVDRTSESVTFGIELPSGAAVDVRGPQFEAQPARSGYRKTSSTTGRYPETRFDQDELTFQANGIDDFSTTIRLVSRVRL